MAAESRFNAQNGFVAPQPPTMGKDYEKYSKEYRVYLALLDEFNAKSFTRSESPASSKVGVTANFAQQVQTFSFPDDKAEPLQDGLTIRHLNQVPTTTGLAKGLVSMGKLKRRESTMSDSTAVGNNLPESRVRNTLKVKTIGDNPKTSWVQPRPEEVEHYLNDCLDADLILYLGQNNRLPKSYKSLSNLREMADRKCNERNLPLLSVSDWKVVTRT
jgi:hypothetical protein